ncbi:MBL fold metallo-hydrolase [Paenibacillus flagellatus]|uniref:Adenosylcobinamide kinase n=1 Tax=Paenibacillus flagellatus TaxID=2211139 RepID=A0A2V5KVV6_9BACL|nr:MBL fold metallo-hydrolase [Paenibacillus flagellatus]PYI56327.1 adenosylcobinamide kinase [Paenibacillus flagellatus]
MRLTFLGTGAAEGIPSPFCDCPGCTHARAYGGRNVRSRQSVLVDDKLLVDIGPDVFASCARLGVSLLSLEAVLVTHSHLDHFDPSALKLRAKPFRLATELPEIAVAAGPSVWTRWDESGGSDEYAGIRRAPMMPGRRLRLPSYEVEAIEASHHLRIGDAMNYIIDDGIVLLLYASDTGLYADHVWETLSGRKLDAVVMEGTIWSRPPGREHLNRGDFGTMVERLRGIGAIGDGTVVVATHFSHQGIRSHEETEADLRSMGAVCAYDGLVLDIGPAAHR